MEPMFIGRDHVACLLDALMEGYTVVAPVERKGPAVFDRLASGSEAALSFTASAASPKEAVMPRLETLLSLDGDGSHLSVQAHTGRRRPLILFGSRPCDARGFKYLDEVFLNGPDPDIYYRNRRESLLIVSIGCREPLGTCFCTTTGGGPMSTEGSDVFLVGLDSGYQVQAVTGKGAALLNDPAFKRFLNPAASVCEPGSPRAEVSPGITPAGLKEMLDAGFVSHRWLDLTGKCLSCGVCTFVCPTCHCFDLVDEEGPGVKVRNRIWDSCQFPCFTEQASGHNPRPTSLERYRQRVMHKFSYSLDKYGMAGCVGCGRCVRQCPVGLDIRQVLLSFHEGGGE